MNNNNNQNEQLDFEDKNEGYIIRDLIDIVIRNWYWFVVSVAIALIVGYFYSSSRPFVFARNATIIIKDERKNGVSPELAAFADVSMGVGMQRTDVESEVYILKSKYLMALVVENLGLNYTYTQKQGLRSIDIYNETPITLNVTVDDAIKGVNFEITPLNSTQAKVSYLFKNPTTGEAESVSNETVKFGDTTATKYFKFTVTKSPYFSDKEINKVTSVSYVDIPTAENYYSNIVGVGRADKTTALVTLSIRDKNAQRAEDILNTMVAVYNTEAIKNKNAIARNTDKFINERLVAISSELGDVDTEVEVFKKDNNITDLTIVSQMALQKEDVVEQDVIKAEMQKNVVVFFIECLTDPKREHELIPSIALDDVPLNTEISKYNEKMLLYNNLKSASGTKNPVIVDMENALTSSKIALVGALENTLQSIKIKIKDINTQKKQVNKRIESVPTKEKEIVNIMRQQKIKEELYLYLLNKREENAITLAITEPNARVVDRAFGRDIPTSPDLRLDLMVAVLFGLAVPAVIMFVINILDTKVRGRSDVERFTTVPILGELPKLQKKNKSKDQYVVVVPQGKDVISEMFNILCFDMKFITKKEGSRALVSMFTSSISGEGKTYCTLNMAISLANLGYKVMVVDMDIRKSSTSKALLGKGIKIHGITNWLIDDKGKGYKDYVIKGVQNNNLDLMPSGAIPPNPINILLDPRLDDMVNDMRSDYDYVLIDSVPAGIVADSGIISRFVDSTLYVVRSRVLDRRYLLDIEKMYRDGKFKNMTFVLTDVDITKGKYGYGRGYGYGYAYGVEK